MAATAERRASAAGMVLLTLNALRSSLSALAVIALIALLFSRRIPTGQPALEPT